MPTTTLTTGPATGGSSSSAGSFGNSSVDRTGLGALRRGAARLRRAVLVRRRWLAAICAAAATAAGLQAVGAAPAATTPVVVAARALPAGATLDADDLTIARWPADLAPPDGQARVEDVAGDHLAGPVGEGEPVTGGRIAGPGLADAAPGLTALPVRLPDSGVVELVDPGDRIDLIATDPADGTSRPLADGVLVLAVPQTSASTTTPGAGPGAGAPAGSLVVLALSPDLAVTVSGAALSQFLTVGFSR